MVVVKDVLETLFPLTLAVGVKQYNFLLHFWILTTKVLV